jgi:hypothetical protein
MFQGSINQQVSEHTQYKDKNSIYYKLKKRVIENWWKYDIQENAMGCRNVDSKMSTSQMSTA